MELLDHHFQGYHWRAFNRAGSAILLGMLLSLASDLLAPAGHIRQPAG